MSSLTPAPRPAAGSGPDTVDGPGVANTRTRVRSWRLLAANPLTVAAAIVLTVVVLASALAPWIAPYGVNQIDVANALTPPSAAHWFGTDELGRDVLSRVLLAGGTSLTIAVVAVTIALVLGLVLGVVAGYAGGWVDATLMRVVDVMFAFPVLLLALAIIAIFQPGMLTTTIAIGVVYTPIFARVARASTLSLRTSPFVQVSRTMGTPAPVILVRHVLPNIGGPIVVQTSLSLAFAILSEAALSFLGLGIQPPAPSWGGMLFTAQGFLSQAWWMSVFPGAAIFVTALAFNLLGDGLRDGLDPRQRTLIEARQGERRRRRTTLERPDTSQEISR
ncbi:ABC-type dipeptide/oligopeptide/nickel transport systems, permease components [Microbacterium testaceum StLB037]|uniref:ABC-type dipeptide/oligopeptide/nickel transport systems, permease components n=1 Tax=Microbacterium testaceum (strain StLB037) TaxID=979556 RepID=E8N896_MICTS|nr:ABC transporter permease [Microbacterium testaceum]BAJ73116.1 ABC-type dipeptide/oligopeptide/nickel transport systems, permease components [Microbacterium testaceum StLB037]